MSYIDETGLAEVTTKLKTYVDSKAGGDNSLPAFLNDTLSEINDTAGEIKQVKAYAFANTKITKINLPQCEVLHANAFYYANTDLSLLSLPNCKGLYQNAFFYCGKLSQIDLPNCTHIRWGAFQGCSSLTTVNIPNCTYLDSETFRNCSYITTINTSNLMIIGASAFQGCSRLTSLNTSQTIVINGSAFTQCYNLPSIDLTNALYINQLPPQTNNVSAPIAIGLGGVSNNSSLYTIYAPYISTVFSYTYNGCFNLSSCFMPTVAYINSYAFQNCSALSKFYTQTSVFGSYAFKNCTSLSEMYILRCGIPTLSTQAFSGTLLSTTGSIYVPSSWVSSFKTATNWTAFANNIYELPSELNSKYVFAGEFAGQTSLTEIPSEKANVEYVLAEGFKGCGSLESINLPSCKYIGYQAFMDKYQITYTSISLPLCEIFAGSVFDNCSVISSLDLPNCKVFWDRPNWHIQTTSISLPECIFLSYAGNGKIQYIDAPKCKIISGMGQLTALVSINLPNCISATGGYLFSSCYNLTKLSLPNLISLTGSANFVGCSKLSQLIIGLNNPFPVSVTSSYIFGNINPIVSSGLLGYYGSIYVPDSLVSAYQTAQYWSSYSARITGISNLPSV